MKYLAIIPIFMALLMIDMLLRAQPFWSSVLGAFFSASVLAVLFLVRGSDEQVIPGNHRGLHRLREEGNGCLPGQKDQH